MKKALAVILSLIMALSFAACSKANEEQTTTSVSEKTTTSNEDTTNADSDNKETKASDASSDDNSGNSQDEEGPLNSNEIYKAPEGAVVVDNLKAKKCKVNLMSLPTTVNAIYPISREKKTTTTINTCEYSFEDQEDGKVSLTLKINGTKKFDAEGGKLSSSFLVQVFDSKNNIVAKSVVHSNQIAVNESFDTSVTYLNLTDKEYSIAFVQTT